LAFYFEQELKQYADQQKFLVMPGILVDGHEVCKVIVYLVTATNPTISNLLSGHPEGCEQDENAGF
jgi:hypothetical protein